MLAAEPVTVSEPELWFPRLPNGGNGSGCWRWQISHSMILLVVRIDKFLLMRTAIM